MDTGLLELYVDVMRQHNFSAVARSRNLDPTSVSRAIASLERELNLKLFHRSTRRLTPTEAGLVYFSRIEPLIEELQRARLQASDVQDRPRGTLRVQVPVSFGQLNIVPLIPHFLRLHPELELELIMGDRPLDLLEERIDLALRLGPLDEGSDSAEQLAKMDSRVCATPQYLQQHGKPARPGDLLHHPCLTLHMPGFGGNWHFQDQNGQTETVQVKGPVRTSNALALKSLALSHLGIILQARWIVGRELASGELVDVFPEHQVSAADFADPAVWLVYPTRSYLPLKVQVLVNFLKRAFLQGPPWQSLLEGT
ncbi:LysR family transcriptional regulator [Deinococcus roseus]|uniref:LysR family transcriptional regulator n=1 Tax=Deinococcus roseus TaxID=392414 RepID=A0ABQ2DF29_9DEIO|nr:LysR family transcriptional regulator [Deinococcus roseus]GGJ55539.1 LysR family transcriptional regulator [Deinococcus roseus]